MKGDIILIPFPFTDLTTSKIRPALVIAERDVDVVVAAISSIIPSDLGDHEVIIEDTHPEFNLTNLRKTSVVILDKIATIEKNKIKGKLGEVGTQLKKEINRKLGFQL